MNQAPQNFSLFFPFFDQLSEEQKSDLLANAPTRIYQPGDIIISNEKQCLGLLLIQPWQTSAF